jgi:Ca-activated chloride channel family protein
VAHHGVQTGLDLGRPAGDHEAYGLLTLTPPEPGRQRAARRDLILLLDTSGSMDGDPLRQLKRTALALIDSLSDRDTLEMIEFSSSARRWNRAAKEASSSVKRDARSWVSGLRAGGGTEMVSGMLEALAPLTERSQRQVVLMTDGYIGQERDVITQVMHRLPRGSCRVHVVGVGSSVNRTLTAGVARAGAGVELILAPGEDAERLVSGLLARTASPLVTHVEVRGDALVANAPAYLPDLYAGSPALISLQLHASGGSLTVSGHTADGPWSERITVPPCGEGQGTVALAKLFARETVEDLELAHATTLTDHAAIDREIERLGLRYQIATRLTTWVAVSQEQTVDPSRPSRHEVVAHEVPQGTSVAGMGLRRPSPAMAGYATAGLPAAMPYAGAPKIGRAHV